MNYKMNFFTSSLGCSSNWQRMKSKDFSAVESLLQTVEKDYVSACSRFICGDFEKDPVWFFREKNENPFLVLLNSRSTIMPVLNGKKEIPQPSFLKSFLQKKKIHSVQGPPDEVSVIEKEMEGAGRTVADVFDYDLMDLDTQPYPKTLLSGPSNLILRVPRMTDLDQMAPLQAGYEKEEVIPKGSVFSPAASRINLSGIIAQGQVLAAELTGRLVGKINVSGISFTRYLVGGVYVHPDFRGLGIAQRMTAEFVSNLVREGRGVTLFVKKSNTPARKLYAGLGFTVTGDYRITYF